MILEPIYKYFALALELGKISEGSAVALVELVGRLGSPGQPADVPPEKARYEVRGLHRFPREQSPDRLQVASGTCSAPAPWQRS